MNGGEVIITGKYSDTLHAKLQNESSLPTNLIKVEDRDYNVEEMFLNWIAPTASFFMRREVVITLPKDNRIINGDINLVLNAFNYGMVRGFSDTMSVYRVQENGLTLKRAKDNALNLQKKYITHYQALSELYPFVSSKSVRRRKADAYINIGVLSFKYNFAIAFYYVLKSLIVAPRRFFERLSFFLKIKRHE